MGLFGTRRNPMTPFKFGMPAPSTPPMDKTPWSINPDGGPDWSAGASAPQQSMTPSGKPNILGIISDGLLAAGGGQPIYMQYAAMQRQAQAAAQAAEAKRQADLQDYGAKLKMEADLKPKDPYRWRDNAGNLWEIGQNGQERRVHTDMTPKYYVQGDSAIEIPNAYASQELPPIDSQQPPVTNMPPPMAGNAAYDNGLPPGYTVRTTPTQHGPTSPVMTPQMVQGLIDQRGRSWTEDYLRRNNISVGGR